MTSVGSIYGEALYSLAHEEDMELPLLEQLMLLDDCFSSEPLFLRMLSAPDISKAERCQILDDSFRGKVAPYVLNFLKLLTEKGYINHFSYCVTAYRDAYYAQNGILPVTAVTAIDMSDDQKKRLEEKLHSITGKSIRLTNKVDASVLGGVRLDFDGKRIDDTVSHRLDEVRSMLQNTVL